MRTFKALSKTGSTMAVIRARTALQANRIARRQGITAASVVAAN